MTEPYPLSPFLSQRERYDKIVYSPVLIGNLCPCGRTGVQGEVKELDQLIEEGQIFPLTFLNNFSRLSLRVDIWQDNRTPFLRKEWGFLFCPSGIRGKKSNSAQNIKYHNEKELREAITQGLAMYR